MNVIVANRQHEQLATLDIDIIKSITGEYDAEELIDMFENFFFAKMILDITAIKDYKDISNIQKISMGLDVEKLIFLLPSDDSEMASSTFLTKIISMGIYNFTTNIDGVKYLLENPNTYKDVAHIQQLNDVGNMQAIYSEDSSNSDRLISSTRIIGIKNVSDSAGATTLIYMMKKELETVYGEDCIYAVEVNRHDLSYFNMKNTISTTNNAITIDIGKLPNGSIVLVDLNDCKSTDICGDVLYLVDPSTIKLNKLMRRNRNVFSELKGKRVILNKSMLTTSDISDFEYEAKTRIFANVPPLDERKKNPEIETLLAKMGLVNKTTSTQSDNGLLGIFKK